MGARLQQDRRLINDRRSGKDRRTGMSYRFNGTERRCLGERRSGQERRRWVRLFLRIGCPPRSYLMEQPMEHRVAWRRR
jgi:hypothetical protein